MKSLGKKIGQRMNQSKINKESPKLLTSEWDTVIEDRYDLQSNAPPSHG